MEKCEKGNIEELYAKWYYRVSWSVIFGLRCWILGIGNDLFKDIHCSGNKLHHGGNKSL